MTLDERASFVRGVRLGIPFGAIGFVLSMSFSVLAIEAGAVSAHAGAR